MPVVLGYCWNTVHTVGELLVFPSFVRHESTILSKERLPLPYVPVPGGREVVVVLVTGTWVKIPKDKASGAHHSIHEPALMLRRCWPMRCVGKGIGPGLLP